MTKMLITRPRHDKATNYLFEWSKEVIDAAESKGWNISKTDGEKANRIEVQSRLQKVLADFVFFNGHGNEYEICGHNLENIIDRSSSRLLKNSVVFARSCNCLAGLGGTAVENGCKAFVGYSDNFWFPMIEKYELTPLKDTAARSVLEHTRPHRAATFHFG